MRANPPIGILSGVILLGIAALSSTAAIAESAPEAETRSVRYTQADLSEPGAVEALYERIQRAARIVCEEPNAREIYRLMQFKTCYDKALDTAVATVNATALIAIHRGKNQRLAAG